MLEMVKSFKEKVTAERKDKFSEASKVVRQPDVFHPKSQEEELVMWQDWRLTFRSWITYAQDEFRKDLDEAEKATEPMDFLEMSVEQHARSEKLYSILVGLLRGRPLKILRSVEDSNGLEVWRELTRQMAPKTRARSISLLQAFLQHPAFTKEKSIMEQVLGLERLAEEYHSVAKEAIAENIKLSVLLRAVPAHLRQHLQLQMDEKSSYATIRERVISYERTTTSWSSNTVYKELDIKDFPKQDEPTPMEIDMVGKGSKGKGKKGKGKFAKGEKGKNSWKGDGKGKSKNGWKGGKGKGKGGGKQSGEKGKGKNLPYDACKLCGERGHWGRECPVRSLRQVAQDAESQSKSTAVSSGNSNGQSGQTAAVRRVQVFHLDEEPDSEAQIRMVKEDGAYDMTYSDDDEDWCHCDALDTGDAHFEAHIDLTMDEDKAGGSRPQEGHVRAVQGDREVRIVLDSGADMSVLPLSFGKIGVPLSKKSVLRDAQGNVMKGGSLRQAVVVLQDEQGSEVHLRETFALASVQEPLLSLGKLVKRGWKVGGDDAGATLSYGAFQKQVGYRNNSLVTKAVVRQVEEVDPAAIRAVTITFEGPMKTKVDVPGWQLTHNKEIPFCVVLGSKNYKDSYPQFNRADFPFRSTVIWKGGQWELVEVADKSEEEDEILECEGQETTVISFFAKNIEDINYAGTINPGADDPFLRPRQLEAEEAKHPKENVGWFGKSLEDGVYDHEDGNEEMGEQHEAGDGQAIPVPPRGVPQADEEVEEIEIEGEKFTKATPLRKLREALRICGLPKGRSKDEAWKRLVAHHQNFADNLALELARREFERKKHEEGGEDVRGQLVPYPPTKAERQLHELSHWPFASWCEHCVAARGKADPHRRSAEDGFRQQTKGSFPVVSMDYCYTRGLTEPEEADKEDLRLYSGDTRGGACLVVTDDWTRGVLAIPTPGKGRVQAKYLAEQVIRYISSCGFSTCTIKADGEPSTRLLLDIIQKCRLKMGFKTLIEYSGPQDSQGNGRVEREIQTVRGLARTLVRNLRQGCQVEINCYGPVFQWAMRHASWLLTHYRRMNGSPTAYEMVTGRKYNGKLAVYGERVLARLPTANGEDKFKVGIWLGKTDRADFHIVAVEDGLRWTRTIRRLPEMFDANVLMYVRTWPWSVSFGQIGTKSTALLAKQQGAPLPPELSLEFQREAARERAEGVGVGVQAQPHGEGDQSEAGPAEEAATDPSSSSTTTSTDFKDAIDDDMVLEDLLKEVNDEKRYEGGVEASPRGGEDSPKRSGSAMPEGEQSPTKVLKESPRKMARTTGPGASSSSSVPLVLVPDAPDDPQAAGDQKVRTVVGGEVLEDGDLDLEFPDKPPELNAYDLFEVEANAADTELLRLIDLGVLCKVKDENLEEFAVLQTRLVYDWRFRDGKWIRRARLVAKDFNWMDPNRTDVFAPAGGQSLLRVIPAVAQLKGWKLITVDVKDAYLTCDQPRKVKVVLENALATKLGLPREWILGKVLPGQREGAAEWFQKLKRTLIQAGLHQCAEAPTLWSSKEKDLGLLIHVDDMVIGGEPQAVDKLVEFLKSQFKISVEDGDKISFLKRTIEKEETCTRIKVNEKYLEGLVSMFNGVKRRKTPGDFIVNDEPLVDLEDIKRYRSGVGTLLYISGDRPDIQYYVKELAGKLQNPTKGAMANLVQLVGYLSATFDYHVKMDGKDPARSFREKAEGLATGPRYEDADDIWMLEVAVDADWSGQKQTRASTSSGSIFIGGIWVYSYARTQKHVTLSSTESEFVALVSGACEGLLLRAVLTHLVGEKVELKIYGDNSSSLAIAEKEGVCRVKHMSGRLLWVQQRQGKDFQVRKLDTLTNPADLGTKVLPGRRVRFLMKLMGFTNSWEDLGETEFHEEKNKMESKKKIQSIRKAVLHEVHETKEKESSTMVNQVAKKLMKLTLGALLIGDGEALSLTSSPQCLVVADENYKWSTMIIGMLVAVNFVLMVGLLVLLNTLYVKHKRIAVQQKAILWIRSRLYENNARRSERRQRLETMLTAPSEDFDEGEEEEGEMDSEVERVFIRRMTAEDFEGYPEGEEEEGGQVEDVPVEEDGYEGGVIPTGSSTDRREPEPEDEIEEKEEEEDSDFETEYGSVARAMEDSDVYEDMDPDEYEDYRFQMLGDATGVEHYVVSKLSWLRRLPMDEDVWAEIRELMKMQKAIQLGDPKTRKLIVQHLRLKRRYLSHLVAGRVDWHDRMEETHMPDEWVAAHYGWYDSHDEEGGSPCSWGDEADGEGEGEGHEGRVQTDDEEEEDYVEEEEEEEEAVDTAVGGVWVAPASSSVTPGTITSTSSVAVPPPSSSFGPTKGGKKGGKGTNVHPYTNDGKDPPWHDEYDDKY